MKKRTYFFILGILFALVASVSFAQSNSYGSGTSVGKSGSSSMGVGNAAVGGAPSIGGGNSVGSGSSTMGVGNSAGGGTNGYYSTGAPGSVASGYSSKGVEAPGGEYNPNTSEANADGSAEVQPSSSNRIDPDSAQ